MTVTTLIEASLRLIGVLASGETAATEEYADGLAALNQMLSSWSAGALAIPILTRDALTLTGPQSYTFGTAMTWATARPLKIESAAVLTAANVSRPVRVVTVEEWQAYMDKTATGLFAEILYWDRGYPTGTIYLAPKPTAGTLELFSYKPLTAFASLATTVAYPDGYEDFLVTALAIKLAPQFGRPITQDLANQAAEAKTNVLGLNEATLGRPNQVEPQRAA